jgi:radical SAM superfamily enzyme YgiQ (UPF0313 family)
MNKTILINPPFNIAKENYDSSISVGLLSIATYLDSKEVNVQIIDGARQKNHLDLIREQIIDCDYVGLSVMTTQVSNALEISKLIKSVNPGCRVVWGGSHPTFFVDQTIIHPLVDIVVVGEGEITFYDLVSGKDLSEIKGIAYKKEGEIIKNSPQALHNPADTPLFKWELEPASILQNLELIPSLTSRGCPHRCTFCINAITKNRWRARTVEQVLEDLKVIKNHPHFQNKKLRFWDENFFVDINRARSIVSKMIEQDVIIPWETTIRADYIRDGMVNDELEKIWL